MRLRVLTRGGIAIVKEVDDLWAVQPRGVIHSLTCSMWVHAGVRPQVG